jgi:DNA-binding PadR family transcriptional regulator
MFRGYTHFRGPWDERPFQKGNLKYVILGLLKEKPRYGYEIIRALEERSHGFYTPSAGAVYPTLQMIEEMGYASTTEQDGKKVYTITEEGLRFLAENKDSAEEVRSQMRHHWDFEAIFTIGKTMGELSKLGKVLKSHQLRHTDPDKIRRIQEIISSACNEIEAILEE